MEGREVAGAAKKNEIKGGQTEKERKNEDITEAVAEAEGGVDDLIEKGKALRKGSTADWESHQEDLLEKFAEQQEVQMHYRAPTLLCIIDANTNKNFFKEKLLPLGMFDPNPPPMDPFLTMQQPLSLEAIAALRGLFTIRMTSELQGVATKIGRTPRNTWVKIEKEEDQVFIMWQKGQNLQKQRSLSKGGDLVVPDCYLPYSLLRFISPPSGPSQSTKARSGSPDKREKLVS
uniref:Uncharacterized protein n=1 Tax=Chromera velia CCMP2878 TaxID=1169474 RepID=A0A0G4HUJ9_9ALVE|eukprot:Cvel_31898.t1-p1 / transcript=Cvel_31898.t1 / gene=Cvel_31898 / organism=Chromera_velia_CCMP2878 / gene_product=hypothetical protein / transcript_product=hypothetical protein / location=Cvel_scaffold4842:743-1435(+) / protein_length=231 / sequence_SO=supercontig / SO=protein_coding / is_pseudo=false